MSFFQLNYVRMPDCSDISKAVFPERHTSVYSMYRTYTWY